MIIFDLDDTLIDTSGSITPFKMRQCLSLLVSNHSFFPDFEKAYSALLQINEASKSSKEALLSFAQEWGVVAEKMVPVLSELTTPLPHDFSIRVLPFAKEILEFFKKSHVLALVTGGVASFQRQKIEKAGLDSGIFSRIAIPENSVKKPFYEAFVKEFSSPNEKVWVCGDRAEVDLAPAKELGLKTIHIRWGRGKHRRVDWVDHSIHSLEELKGIIA